MGGFLGGFLGPALNATTQTVNGALAGNIEAGKIKQADAARAIQEKRQQREDEIRDAVTSATMRKQGFVPDAERGNPTQTLMDGDALNGIVGMATGGLGAIPAERPDVTAPRYGASVGGFSYDNASPAAMAEGNKQLDDLAQSDLRRAQADFYRQRPNLEQKKIDAGVSNTGTRADASLSAAKIRAEAQRDAARIRAAKPGSGGRGLTGNARVSTIMRGASAYMKPDYLGGLGLSREDALKRATADVDGIVGGAGTAAPDAPAAPNMFSGAANPLAGAIQPQQGNAPTGDVNLGAAPRPPAPTGSLVSVRHPVEAAADAEQMIRNGKGTLEQALASPSLSADAKAVLRRKFAGAQ